jgi:hypothetical protein
MKTTLQSSSGVKVRVREYDEADVVRLVGEGKVAELTIAINADRRQKVALVDFRADLSTLIGDGDEEAKITGLGFSRKVKNVTKDGETIEVPDETEGEHIGRFVTALETGKVTPSGFTLPSGDDKAKETAAYAFLQSLAFKCGDKEDENGDKCYELDITRTPRTGSGGLIPKWAKDAATNIFEKGGHASVKGWHEKLSTGFTSPRGITIDPIPHEDFTVAAPHDATPEVKQQHHERNVKHLAKAIMAYDKQEKAKTASEFV